MEKYFLYSFCFFVLLWNIGTAVKCRTGNQEQYYRIIDNCKKRYMKDDANSGSSSDESTSSNEDDFDRRIMSNGRNGGNFGMNRMGTNRNQNGHRSRDGNNRSYSSSDFNRNMSGMNGRDNDSQRSHSSRRNMNNWRFDNGGNFDPRYDDQRYNYDNQQDQSVDQKGFPERTAVHDILLEDVQDPELSDLIEEAVIQCFHYVNLEGRQNKCQYSQNLLTCLIGKGQEMCEDWNNPQK